jgi:DNA-binding CsgD family transcriptional regulator
MPQDKSGVSTVIEALYAVAADPDQWEQVVEALAGSESGQAAEPGVRPAGAASGGEQVGVLVVGAGGGVLACDLAGRGAFERRLGTLEARGLRFADPANHEALDLARRRLGGAASGQVIVKFVDAENDGPFFVYVMPAAALPESLARRLTPLGAGEARPSGALALLFPSVEATDRLWSSVRESFGLTAAEIRLAAQLAEGLSLKEAAEELGVSVNTLRNQLRAVFDKMGLNRQSELVRALTQLSSLASAFGEAPRISAPAVLARERAAAESAPPIRTFTAPDGRTVAWRDYGAPGGTPVIVVMPDLSSSLLRRGSHGMARDLGLRLLVLERAGIGRTEPLRKFSFEAAAADYLALHAEQRLGAVQVVAFADGAPYGLLAAAGLGPLADRMLLVTGRRPGPQVERAEDAGNLMTLFWRRISKSAWLSDMVFEMLRHRLNRPQFERFARAAGSAPGDAAYLQAHPELIDFMVEYTQEALALSARGASEAIRCAARPAALDLSGLSAPITLWHGADDSMTTPDDMKAWLGTHLREVRIVPGIGRFLGYSHWTEIMQWVAGETEDARGPD